MIINSRTIIRTTPRTKELMPVYMQVILTLTSTLLLVAIMLSPYYLTFPTGV